MDNKLSIFALVLLISIASYLYLSTNKPIFNFSQSKPSQDATLTVSQEIDNRYSYLSKNGNSSCSLSFRDSIPKMPDNSRLIGSCCSPMSLHRYSEQIEGLKQYQEIVEIPPDPYGIEVGVAKKLMSYYDGIQLTSSEQKEYEIAMQTSDEKGPCCCKCWRWYVYGGLGKHLIKNYGFAGKQVADVWNLSDGCGGDSDHLHG